MDRDKKVDLDTLLAGLKHFITRMIKFHLSIKEINEKKRERGPLTFGTEELIPALEADLKTANRVRLFLEK